MGKTLKRGAPAEVRAVRRGRPSRETAGEVEERILDAAAKVFLERGFEGASIDEIAEAASAGKPSIYARFPSKEHLFAAVVMRKVRQNTSLDGLSAAGSTTEERLKALATALLERVLASDSVGLMRAACAEARRFPDLAGSVHRKASEEGAEAIARLLGELARSDETGALPAFAPDRLAATARRFKETVFLPIVVRALFGEDLAALRAEIPSQLSQSIPFFLAACRHGGRLGLD
jgi:AcrR family transcriptional regulator